MRFGISRLSAFLVAAVLLGSCGSEHLLEPARDQPFSAARAEANIGAPSNLVAAVVAGNSIRLTWQDNSTSEKGFELLRSPSGPSGTLELYVETIPAGATSYLDTGVEASTTYCFAVRAFKITGRTKSYSALSPTTCATTPAPSGAPVTPTATTVSSRNSTTILVAWTDNSQDESGFRIERAANVSGPWLAAATVGPNLSSMLDGGRTSETQVCYRVAAFNLSGRSNWSQTACVIPPAGPTNLRATGSTPTTVDLTWSDNSAAEDGYEIQRATAHDGPYLVIAELSMDVTTFHDAELESDHSYWYQVRAKRAGGFSDPAGPTAAVTATTLPAAPTWVSASPFNGWSTYVVWRDNSTNEAGFRLERSDAGGPWVTIMTFGPAAEGLSQAWDGATYPIETEICYRIVAFNGMGQSSDTGCTALPAVPLNLTAKVVDGTVELSWTDISRFEDGFHIVRADGSSMGVYYVYDGVGPNVTTYRDPYPDPEWSSYYLKAVKGPEGYSCCSNAADVVMPPAGGP